MNCQRLVANKYEVAVAVAAVARKLQNYISKLWGMCELWAPAKTLRAVTAVMGHDFERISRRMGRRYEERFLTHFISLFKRERVIQSAGASN